MLVDFNRHDRHLLTEFEGDKFIDVTSSSQKLEGTIRKHNGDDILISTYSASMSLEEAVRKGDIKDNDLKGKVRKMALMLRKEIFRSKKSLLPRGLKPSETQKGEAEVPEIISIFFQNLIPGPDSRRWEGSKGN